MPLLANAGLAPRTTIEEPIEYNGGGCAFCGEHADGYDAVVEQPLCEACAVAFAHFRCDVEGDR